MSEMVEKARNYEIEESMKITQNNRPVYHFSNPVGWMNDPNGFSDYKGEHHLFFQYYPYATYWGSMHWGHATSKDLVNFEHHGIALFPSKKFDSNGCFSGTALIEDDKLHFYYTGIKYLRTEDENIHRPYDNESFEACQVKIESKDGYTFDNFNDKKVVIPPITDRKLGNKTHTRDPKVWKYKDGYSILTPIFFNALDESLFKSCPQIVIFPSFI